MTSPGPVPGGLMADMRMTPALLHLLLCFSEGPKHGYAVMQEVEQRTDGRVRLGPSSLYYSLGRLEDEGLIEETDVDASGAHEERRRYYRLTRSGRSRLREEARMLESVVAHARAHGFLK